MAAVTAGTAGRYKSIHPADRRLVGLDAGADMLGISRSNLHALVHRGEFESVRIGRRLLVTVESIDAYIERLRRAEKSETTAVADTFSTRHATKTATKRSGAARVYDRDKTAQVARE